jgi:hypothetical protein
MRVIALVEYEVLGDDEYAYVERFEKYYNKKAVAVWSWKIQLVHSLLVRGIIVKSIKEISVEYED